MEVDLRTASPARKRSRSKQNKLAQGADSAKTKEEEAESMEVKETLLVQENQEPGKTDDEDSRGKKRRASAIQEERDETDAKKIKEKEKVVETEEAGEKEVMESEKKAEGKETLEDAPKEKETEEDKAASRGSILFISVTCQIFHRKLFYLI